MQSHLQSEYFQQIYEHIQDGIILIKENREIFMMNPAAQRLTGWQIGDFVPLCSYCMNRKKKQGEQACYLIANNEVPSFLSEMPTYHGRKIDVEMSTAAIYANENTGETEYLLVLRDQVTYKKAQESAINKKMIRALIEAKESEHKRLAQELHDGVGQSLFSISIAMQAIESFVQDNDLLNEYTSEVSAELQKVMNDINAYSHQLRPHSLDQLGLEPTIQTTIDTIKKNIPDLEIQLTTCDLDRCDSAVEINLYRITQEALRNIIKYANSTKVHIQIKKDDTHIYMIIEDNGVGFSREKIKNEGLGLKHMEERVDQLGGTCSIVSKIGKGTCIDIVVPKWRP